MKRTPLHRKTRLRPMSAKKRKQIARLSPLRRAYRESFTVCMCGCGKRLSHDYGRPSSAGIHEIIGASQRDSTVEEPAFWLCLRNDCHDRFPSLPQRHEVVHQCALKFRFDNKRFDLDAVNEIWMRNGAAGITQQDIDNEIRIL